MLTFTATDGRGKQTQVAGTAITEFYPPKKGQRTVLTRFNYTPGATSHTGTVMRQLGKTTLNAAAAASQAAVVLKTDPGSIAANDIVVLRCSDGSWFLTTVSARTVNGDGTVSVTLAANLPVKGESGADVLFFGVVGDHTTGTYPLPTGSTTDVNEPDNGIASGGQDEGLILRVDNITAAGVLNFSRFGYAQAA